MRLGGGPEAAAEARGALEPLRSDLNGRTLETLRLLVTELVANGVRHARSRTLEVKAIASSGSVWVEVADLGSGFDPELERRRAAERQDSGWGLMLVDELSARWGVARADGTNRVWFELGSRRQ